MPGSTPRSAAWIPALNKVDTRFESIERRLEMIQGDLHGMDIRITRFES